MTVGPELLSGIDPKVVLAFIARNSPTSKAQFLGQLRKDLRSSIQELERVRHDISNYDDSGLRKNERENGLRSRLAGLLRAREYRATAEEDVGGGHADLIVVCPSFDLIWMAECKIHDGYEEHEEGMVQLHTRYSSGRHSELGFIIFCFAEDSNSVIGKWRQIIIVNKTCNLQGDPTLVEELEFSSLHKHVGSGLVVETRHFIVTLYYDPKDVEFKVNRSKEKAAAREAKKAKKAIGDAVKQTRKASKPGKDEPAGTISPSPREKPKDSNQV